MIEDILRERGNRYGSYTKHSTAKESLTNVLETLPNWHNASPIARQGAIMICDKLARAFNGDFSYSDNWVDIQGYAKLVENFFANEYVVVKDLAPKDLAPIIPTPPNNAGSFKDPRDGTIYPLVRIGNKLWFQKNLCLKTLDGKTVGRPYNNDESYEAKYGRLYTWQEAMDICPPGWRLPTIDEWKDVSFKQMKKDLQCLPGGNGTSDGYFLSVGGYGYWWSATEYDASYAYYRSMNDSDANVSRDDSDKAYLLSVRCLQDIKEAKND